jgi:hypothetical protein
VERREEGGYCLRRDRAGRGIDEGRESKIEIESTRKERESESKREHAPNNSNIPHCFRRAIAPSLKRPWWILLQVSH